VVINGPKRITYRVLPHDLTRLITTDAPLVFDVGANKGQTIELMRRALRSPRIHAFEPAEALALDLRARYNGPDIVIQQYALGAREEVRPFIQYENNELSSLLPLSQDASNPFRDMREQGRETVTVDTVSSYSAKQGISRIDLLKIDTQGFDFEVLKGAEAMLQARQVGAVLIELNFSSLYANQCSVGEVIDWLGYRGYGLLAFYEVVRLETTITWVTALFLPRPPCP
jgi:FkbM family methyltransferase